MLKQIEGFEDYYVSDKGDVYSNKRSKLKKLKPGNTSGYLRIIICNAGHPKGFLIHRLVAQAFIPNPENKPCVNHKDGNKHNNCVDNLEWCTYEENNQYFQEVQKPNVIYEQWSDERKEQARKYQRMYYKKNAERCRECKRRCLKRKKQEMIAQEQNLTEDK